MRHLKLSKEFAPGRTCARTRLEHSSARCQTMRSQMPQIWQGVKEGGGTWECVERGGSWGALAGQQVRCGGSLPALGCGWSMGMGHRAGLGQRGPGRWRAEPVLSLQSDQDIPSVGGTAWMGSVSARDKDIWCDLVKIPGWWWGQGSS